MLRLTYLFVKHFEILWLKVLYNCQIDDDKMTAVCTLPSVCVWKQNLKGLTFKWLRTDKAEPEN